MYQYYFHKFYIIWQVDLETESCAPPCTQMTLNTILLKHNSGDYGINWASFVFSEVIEINTDSSAALGIASRRGLGKVRHVELNQRWIQDKVANGEITIMKCPGIMNPADALTKHLNEENTQKHIQLTSSRASNSRHELAPEK